MCVWTLPQDAVSFSECSHGLSDAWWEMDPKCRPKVGAPCPRPCWRAAAASRGSHPWLRPLFSPQHPYRKPGGATCVFQLRGHVTSVRTVAFSPDGLALVSGGTGGLMNIWSLRVSGPDNSPGSILMGISLTGASNDVAAFTRTARCYKPWWRVPEPSRTSCGSQMWVWPCAPTGPR